MLLFKEKDYEQDLLTKNISKKMSDHKTLKEKKKDLDTIARFEEKRTLFIKKISQY